ncbi:MAG: kelch repeat-containing protein [Spirochaetales bacterium]|nr:kelch repeat-containing protein [Spirochaetales bacterium]
MKRTIIIIVFIMCIIAYGCDTGTIDPEITDSGTVEVKAPEIDVLIGTDSIESSGSYDFSDVQVFKTVEVTGTIKNSGNDILKITDVSISGTDEDSFSITSEPNSTVEAGGSTTFTISLSTGTETETKSATLTISNNDSDESSYTVSLTATITTRAWSEETSAADWSSRKRFQSVVYNDKIWVLGGYGNSSNLNDVWNSSDGASWSKATDSADWIGRYGFSSVVFNNQIWVMGGYGNSSNLNDVWNSSDGASWSKATDSADWSARQGLSSVVYNDKIWILGGYNNSTYYNDVWSSSNGTTWTKIVDNTESDSMWSARGYFQCVVFKDKLWVLGGCNSDSYSQNDIWYSSNGQEWNKVDTTDTESNPMWTSRMKFQCIVYNDKLWVLGGYYYDSDNSFAFYHDIWYSSDGTTWTKTTNSAVWDARRELKSVVYNDKIWVLGGYYEANGYSYYNDVWSW